MIPRCAWCGAKLQDRDGQPRWEIFGGGGKRSASSVAVCYGRCTKPIVRPYRQYLFARDAVKSL